MSEQKTILILGGGIGGIVAARELGRLLTSKHRIVLVDRSSAFSFQPSLPWVMIGWRKPELIQKPLSALAAHGIEFHHAEVLSINPDEQTVQTTAATIHFDYLVVALGAESAPPGIPGYGGAQASSFYTPADALALSRTIPEVTSGTIAILVTSMEHSAPPAPFEAAFLLESYFQRKGIPGITIKVITPEELPLESAGFGAGKELADLLSGRRIEVLAGQRLASVDGGERILRFEGGTSVRYDLLITIPEQRAPAAAARSGLTDSSGWVPVDERTMRTRHRNILAIGDITRILLPDGKTPLPKVGVFAHDHAEIVAYNIAQEISNSGIHKVFTGTGQYFLETGNSRAGFIHGNFYSRPAPAITMSEPSVTFHWGKVVYEKYWLWRWF
jgi:sulfide:quinone oxidoreductase